MQLQYPSRYNYNDKGSTDHGTVISLDSLVVQNPPQKSSAPSVAPCPIIYFLYVNVHSFSSSTADGAVAFVAQAIFLHIPLFTYLAYLSHTREQVIIYITL